MGLGFSGFDACLSVSRHHDAVAGALAVLPSAFLESWLCFQQASSSYCLPLQTDAYKEVSQKPDFGSVTLSNKSFEFSWDLVEHSSSIIWSFIEVFIIISPRKAHSFFSDLSFLGIESFTDGANVILDPHFFSEVSFPLWVILRS